MAEAVNELVQISAPPQRFLRRFLQVAHRRARPDGSENVLLRLVHRSVHFGLLFGELAAHRVGARDVGRIPSVLGARVDYDQVAGTQHARVLAPMKHRSVLAAPHDGAVGEPRSAGAEKRELHLRLHVALAHSRYGRARRRIVTCPRDGHGPLEQRNLLWSMRRAHPREQIPLVDQFQAQGARRLLQRLHVGALVLEVFRRRDDGETVVRRRRPEQPFAPVSAPHFVDGVLRFQRGAERRARSRPALRLGIPRTEKEDVPPVLRLGHQDEPGAGLVDAGQPEEIVVLPVLLHYAGGLALRGDGGGAPADLLHQAFAAVAVEGGRKLGRRLRIRVREPGGGQQREQHGDGEGNRTGSD